MIRSQNHPRNLKPTRALSAALAAALGLSLLAATPAAADHFDPKRHGPDSRAKLAREANAQHHHHANRPVKTVTKTVTKTTRPKANRSKTVERRVTRTHHQPITRHDRYTHRYTNRWHHTHHHHRPYAHRHHSSRFIPGHFKRVWVQPVYRYRYNACGNRFRVLVRAGHYKRTWVPGRWAHRPCRHTCR